MTPLDAATAAAFTDEFRHSLPAIASALDAAGRDRQDRAGAREAHRLIHALKGAASMVGLAALGYLLNAVEERLEHAIAPSGPIAEDALTVARQALPLLQTYIDTVLAGTSVELVAIELLRVTRPVDEAGAIPILRELLDIETREIAATAANDDEAPQPSQLLSPIGTLVDLSLAKPFASSLPTIQKSTEHSVPALAHADIEVVPATPIPPELVEIFALEAQEHLETIARVTAILNPAVDDRESLQELRRSVHTLKGAAGVVGYSGAAKLAHRMEDLLDLLYEGGATLNDQIVRTLSSSSDALNDIIVGVPDVPQLQAIVGRLFNEFDRHLGVALPAPSSAESADAEVAQTPTPAIRAAVDPPVVERRRRPDRRGSGQVLRVPVERLNELVRVISELVINRSTFEQHHLALIEQIDELKLSTARLRRVTHKLESDYEVRALGGNMTVARPAGGREAGSSGGHGFDDLEFDRYTEFHLLTRELTEITSDIATIGNRVAGTIGDFDGDLTRLGRLTREVQDKTMEFRMVPLSTLATQIERAVRSTAETCGKKVDVSIEGGHVALDKALLEQMSEPLLHLLRNAVDHGIEREDQRIASGKASRGRVTVRAFHEGTDVLIEVEDDGAGLSVERIRRTAIARGRLSTAEAASTPDEAVFNYIFDPGFSTAEQVTEVSGRGVGMDVVKSKVARAGGRVYITSRPGAGTTISVRVPMTLAITRILLVRSGGETFGLPLAAVEQIARPHPTSIGLVGSERVFTIDGKTYPLRDLSDALGLARSVDAPAIQPVLIANLSRRRIALAVDEIVNSRDVVVKTLGTHLRRVPGIWGATLLGDGTVVLILNPVDLAGAAEGPVIVRPPVPRLVAAREPYTVMVVDDSLSMRHVLSMAVKKAGWTPVPARDGLEALDLMQRAGRPPDLVLLDIEMPRMDGFEFLSAVRAQKGRADLPVVMLTSRSGDKHRDRAAALGATDYMVKPFQEDVLVRNIERLVQASRRSDARAAS